jgi:hypothetical protein
VAVETPTRQRHGNARMLYLVELYQREHGVGTVDLDEVAKWAISEGHYRPEPIDPAKALKGQMAKAMKNEHITDPQDREVRKWHAVRHTDGERQWTLWATILDADPGHMRMSLQQRRQYLLSGCRQHREDFRSYNDNNKFGVQIPLFSYNFEADFDEMDLPTDYPDEPGDEE